MNTRAWAVEDAVLATVLYADLFEFPLDRREIWRDLIGVEATPEDTDRVLDRLCASGRVIRFGEYFVLPGRTGLVARRAERRQRTQRLWPIAMRLGAILAALPFVRMVAITGSLAVGNPDPVADLDFLLVTTRRRLWLARAGAVLLARIVRAAGVSLCPNYLITTDALVLEQRDLYTAHELLQAIPVAGGDVYRQWLGQNSWVAQWLPNRFSEAHRMFPALASERSLLKGLGERILGGSLGEYLEHWEGRRKRARLAQSPSAARFSEDVCEGHYGHHRTQVLQNFWAGCAELYLNVHTFDDVPATILPDRRATTEGLPSSWREE